jgi:hypothetical protein
VTYAAQVADALSAVEARPPAAYLWFGRRFAAPAPELAAAIGARLLADFQATGAARPAAAQAPVPATGDGGALARALSQANSSRGCWQGGWRIGAPDGDAIAVERPGGLRLLAPPEDCRDGAVRLPKELLGFSPGTYVALGDAPGPAGALVRLSWNIAATGAVALVTRLTYVLNGAGLPFRLELPDDPARYGRRDAAGLVLARGDFPAAVKLLRPLLRALGPHLADGAPALTKPLARGLAVAEEPGDGRSFGVHRCGLLAEAVVTAGERRQRGAAERLALVGERFAAAGLTLGAPYLQPGSVDAYELS